MSTPIIRLARPDDRAGAYDVCLRTGDAGDDGAPVFREDPDALGRLFVGPYLAFEPELSLVLEDDEGICGYSLDWTAGDAAADGTVWAPGYGARLIRLQPGAALTGP